MEKAKSLKWCMTCEKESMLVDKCQRKKTDDCVVVMKCDCLTTRMIMFPNRLECPDCPMWALKTLK